MSDKRRAHCLGDLTTSSSDEPPRSTSRPGSGQELLLTSEEFRELVRLGYEAPGLEFKPPAGRTDPRVGAEVVRASIAFANRRGGGRVVIGVAEDQKQRALVPVGLDPAQRASCPQTLCLRLARGPAPMQAMRRYSSSFRRSESLPQLC